MDPGSQEMEATSSLGVASSVYAIKLRPCGACAALVPADAGCGHWSPGVTEKPATIRQRALLARRRAELEAIREFRRMMTREAT
jgi:hypothetical protein